MKKIFTIILIAISLQLHSQTLVDSSKTWNILECSFGIGTWCSTITPGLPVDTVLNSIQYRMVYPFGAYYREDTATQKVYTRISSNDPEYVLYDFSLGVGDSFYVDCLFPNWGPYIFVDSVDTYQYNGITRKQIKFVDSQGMRINTWIAGIGSLDGFGYEFSPYCTFDYGTQLLCVDSAGIQIYQTPLYSSCNVTLGVEDSPVDDYYTLSPNPFSQKIILDVIKGVDLRLVVFNNLGQPVFENKLHNSQNEIDLSFLQSGIYYCRVISKEGISVKKILKLN